MLTLTEYVKSMTPLVKDLGSLCLNSIHMVDGCTTEFLLELEEAFMLRDTPNIIEEIGDGLFFASQLAVMHGVSVAFVEQVEKGLTHFDGVDIDAQPESLLPLLFKLMDANKGVLVYNRSYDDLRYSEYKDWILQLGYSIATNIAALQYSPWNEITLQKIIDRNYEKLHKVRYKDGYSDDSANNRDIFAEREALENHD